MTRLHRGSLALIIGFSIAAAIAYLVPFDYVPLVAASVEIIPHVLHNAIFASAVVGVVLGVDYVLSPTKTSVCYVFGRIMLNRFRAFAAKLFREGQQPAVGSVGFSTV